MAQEKAVVLKAENMMPIGSLKMLREKMLDLRAYGSCSKSIPGECLGCPAFERCEFPDKGEGRPRNGGVRIVKSDARGGGMREDIMPCFVYWARKDGEEASGSLWDWFAEEGESVTVRGSKPMRKDANGVPMPNTAYEDFIETKDIPEFKGLANDLRLVEAAYRAEIFRKHHEKQRAAKREAAMAPPAGSIATETPSGDDTAGKPKRR